MPKVTAKKVEWLCIHGVRRNTSYNAFVKVRVCGYPKKLAVPLCRYFKCEKQTLSKYLDVHASDMPVLSEEKKIQRSSNYV